MTRPLSTLQRIFTSGWKVGLVRFLVTFSLVAAATAVPLASAPRAAAAEKPRFKMPFNCDEVW
jgi:hypothetical protein